MGHGKEISIAEERSLPRRRLRMRCMAISLVVWSALFAGCATSPLRERPWLIGTSPRFEVFSTMEEAEVVELLTELERFHALIYFLTGLDPVDPPVPTRIYAFARTSDYRVAGGAKKTVGQFVAGLRSNTILLADDGRLMSAKQVVFHEYVHFLLRNGSQLKYPVWYDEGFAELLSTVRVEDDVVVIGTIPAVRANSIRYFDWIDLEYVVGAAGYSDFSASNRHLLYAESWALVHYLLLDRGSERSIHEDLNRYLERRRLGSSATSAFESAFGESLAGLDREIPRLLRKGVRLVGVPESELDYDRSPPLVQPASAVDAALLLGQLRLKGRDWADAEEDFRTAITLAPSNPRAQAGLGDVLKFRNDFVDAERYFERAIELGPEDPLNWIDFAEFLHDRSRTMEDPQGRRELLARAREAYVRALELQPNSAEAWVMLGRTHLEPGENPELAREPTEKAYGLLPSARTTLFSLAELQIALGHERQAVELLIRAFGDTGDADTLEQVSAWIKSVRAHRAKVSGP